MNTANPPDDDDDKAWIKERTRIMKSVIPLTMKIKKENKGKDAHGVDDCPACGGGTVRWAIAAYNGHIRMQCSTEDCVNFME